VGFAATGMTIAFQGVSAVMTEENLLFFEAALLDFLQDNIRDIPDVVSIEFEHVEVTDQSLVSARRQLNTIRSVEVSNLEITFSVFALVLLEEEGVFDFKTLLELFFADIDRVLELRRNLEMRARFFEQVPLGTPSGSGGRLGSNSGGSGQSQDGVPIPMLGAIAGILLSVVGSSAMYVWLRGRGNDGYPIPKMEPTAESSCGDPEGGMGYSDSSMHSYEEESESSTPRILLGDSQSTNWTSKTQHVFESNHIQQSPHEERIYPTESVETSIAPSGLSFYRPALISMESNIEIPETPKTDYEPSQCSPKEDPQPNQFVFDNTPSISSKEKTRNQPPKVKSSFFSPRLLGAWKKGKDSHDAEELSGRKGNPNQPRKLAPIQNGAPKTSTRHASSSISPKRSPISRNILRHDVCADVDAVSNKNVITRKDSARSAAETSIQVMTEVAYLFSRSGRPDPEETIKRDPSFSSRSIQRMNSKGTINGAGVDHSGHVGSFAKKYQSNNDYISDDESYASV
jgi:hypothetical protein